MKESLEQKLDRMRTLKEGWNGYDGLPPSENTIHRAEKYLKNICKSYRPDRVAPSQAGGNLYGSIGFTWRGTDGRRAYLEFYDDRDICLLLSSNNYIHSICHLSDTDQSTIQIMQSFMHGS